MLTSAPTSKQQEHATTRMLQDTHRILGHWEWDDGLRFRCYQTVDSGSRRDGNPHRNTLHLSRSLTSCVADRAHVGQGHEDVGCTSSTMSIKCYTNGHTHSSTSFTCVPRATSHTTPQAVMQLEVDATVMSHAKSSITLPTSTTRHTTPVRSTWITAAWVLTSVSTFTQQPHTTVKTTRYPFGCWHRTTWIPISCHQTTIRFRLSPWWQFTQQHTAHVRLTHLLCCRSRPRWTGT
jgi:hypothetical protein